jgi:hypothetical protein
VIGGAYENIPLLSRDHHPEITFAAVRSEYQLVAVKGTRFSICSQMPRKERTQPGALESKAAVPGGSAVLAEIVAKMILLPRAPKLLDSELTLGRPGDLSL